VGLRTGEAVKPGAALPDDGRVVETTTRSRLIPSNSAAIDAKTPDLWQYLAEIDHKNEWSKHTLYIYRTDPSGPGGKGTPVAKCYTRTLALPDGSQVPVADQEEMEFAFLRCFGGKVYRLIVKRNSQIITSGEIFIDAAPRTIPVLAEPSQNSGSPQPAGDATAQVAGRAFDALTTQERQSAEIGFRAMETAASVMQRFGSGGPDQNTALIRELLAEIRNERKGMTIQEILATVTSIIAIGKELGIIGASGGLMPGLTGEMVGGLFKKIFERGMNPEPTGAPTNATAEIVRMAPQVVGQISEALTQWRAGQEAIMKTVALQRTGMTAAPATLSASPQVIAPTRQAAPAQPAPNNASAAGNGASPQMSYELVEQKILEIFQRPTSPNLAADDALTFLSEVDPSGSVVRQLAQLGEEGLLNYFTSRSVLKPATANVPRLREFIKEFLKMYAEDVAQEEQAKKVN